MPEGKGRVKYAVVAVDYFTKWAEAEALATITAARIETFVWQNILCFASPAHPQSNGQVEAVNKIIKRTLKTKLDKAKGCWPSYSRSTAVLSHHLPYLHGGNTVFPFLC
ncbi:unnamed protein product [Prunus brigantina]